MLDVRRTPTDQDQQMIKFLYFDRIPFKVVVTKTDTLSRSQVSNQLFVITNKLALSRADIIVTSSMDKEGLNELLGSIEQYVK